MPTWKNTKSNTSKNWGTKNYGTSFGGTYGTRNTSRTTGTGSTGWAPTKYSNLRQNVQAKIGSFKTINQQCTGTGKVVAFSPTTANKWVKFIDNGCWIYKFSNKDFTKFFGTGFSGTFTPSNAQRFLQKKFGAGIKAVTRGKNSSWLIAATPNVSGRPFNNYNW